MYPSFLLLVSREWRNVVQLRLMDKILHDPKDPKLWELWYIPYYGSCRILSINRITTITTILPFPTNQRKGFLANGPKAEVAKASRQQNPTLKPKPHIAHPHLRNIQAPSTTPRNQPKPTLLNPRQSYSPVPH